MCGHDKKKKWFLRIVIYDVSRICKLKTIFLLFIFFSEEKRLRAKIKELLKYRRNGITKHEGKQLLEIFNFEHFPQGSSST